ncbi:MAG: D-aminoacyl-tRNA deacylase [Candidatus Eremiobacteraeota bacterium]|nr:D-aminoacyl-tRNA deacylase [Candidatus Eremiobacteraeota bacterium]
MRAVVQRVSKASVRVAGATCGEIAAGILALVSVGVDDAEVDATALAQKVTSLRIFRDDAGLMNRSVLDVHGEILLVSQFTLHGDARKGRRPSFVSAAGGNLARELYELVGRCIERTGTRTQYGEFGADMEVELVNDGPVTILLDTKRVF